MPKLTRERRLAEQIAKHRRAEGAALKDYLARQEAVLAKGGELDGQRRRSE
jgi:hypothetical protein